MAQGTKVKARALMMLVYGTAFSRPGKPWQKTKSSKGIRPRAAILEHVVITILEGYQRKRRCIIRLACLKC